MQPICPYGVESSVDLLHNCNLDDFLSSIHNTRSSVGTRYANNEFLSTIVHSSNWFRSQPRARILFAVESLPTVLPIIRGTITSKWTPIFASCSHALESDFIQRLSKHTWPFAVCRVRTRVFASSLFFFLSFLFLFFYCFILFVYFCFRRFYLLCSTPRFPFPLKTRAVFHRIFWTKHTVISSQCPRDRSRRIIFRQRQKYRNSFGIISSSKNQNFYWNRNNEAWEFFAEHYFLGVSNVE